MRGRDVHYPFASHYLDVGGVKLHYVDEGQGEPIVMVHGNPTWSFFYRRVIAALRPKYRAIAVDHIGCGLSDKPTSGYDYTLARRVDDLTALIDHLALKDPITLVVHDWGGMIGMTYATRFPERIARLVVLNTAAFRIPSTKRFPWQLRLARGPLGALLVRGLNLFSRGALASCIKEAHLTAEERAAYLAPYDSWAHRLAVHRFVEDIPLLPSDRSYNVVTATEGGLERLRGRPLLIAWGMRDFVFDHHFLAEWERLFPEALVHRFERAGHYVLEDAWSEIVPLIEGFLAKHPLPAVVV